MSADPADGLPTIGETGRHLGVRPGVDIPVTSPKPVPRTSDAASRPYSPECVEEEFCELLRL
jgi:hypothetical protein